ncbi:MAG: hypothetical protein M3282_12975 [Gemmatimonadota bacterium]|nr:hypothetical protein [Gemmatimonadota bacterium]
MTRLSTTSTIAAALLALSILPGALIAQASSADKSTATTITIEVDPWTAGWKRETSQSRIARANLRALNDALEPYRMTYPDLTDGERSEIRRAFGDVLPGQRFTTYRLNAPQARAIAYLALGPAQRGRRDHRCEYTQQQQPVPAPVQAGEPVRPSWCDAALDTMSRNAAWIHTTILALGRSGGARRPKSEELDDLRSMAERAREIVVSTPRCGCTVGDDADALLTGTREAVDAFAGSSTPAWMTLRSEQVQRISKLSDSVERSLLRCLSSR